MAIVRAFAKREFERPSPHSETIGTYAIITGDDGEKYLQLDTYGSSTRDMPGKISQSIRLPVSAVRQIRGIIDEHFA